MKKLVSIILVMLLALALVFTGCQKTNDAVNDTTKNNTQKEETKGEDTEENALSEPGAFPLVKEKATISMLSLDKANIKDITTNEFTKFYEEKTNVHIEWELIPQSSADEKRSLTLASGDYPEVFFGVGITREEELTYGREGVFLPLENLIDKWGVETKKMFEEVPYLRKSITTPDTHIYTLPQVNQCYHCIYAQKLWVNHVWLDNLGLKPPTTTDEFYDMLVAFKTQDPNGNGIADEIPLSGCQDSWHSNAFDFISCAWIFNDGGDRLIVEDGKVDTVVNRDGFRDALRFTHKLYKDGLLDPASLTQDADQYKQLCENSEIELVGVAAGGWFGVFTSLEGDRHKMYDGLIPIKGPEGVQTCGKYPYTYGTGNYAITNKCENPDLAMKWADWLYNQEATLRYVEAGREGHEWQKAADGAIDLRGRQAKWERIDNVEYGEIQNVHYYQMGPSYRDFEYRQSWGYPEDEFASDGYERRLYNVTQEYEPFAPDTSMVYPKTYANPDHVDELSKLKTAIQDLTDESIARFITGDLDIENDWDKYVSDLETAGLARYLEILQEAYNSQFSN